MPKNESIRDVLENLTTYITDPKKGKPYLVKKMDIDPALADIKRILKEKLNEKRGNRLYMGIEEVIEIMEGLE